MSCVYYVQSSISIPFHPQEGWAPTYVRPAPLSRCDMDQVGRAERKKRANHLHSSHKVGRKHPTHPRHHVKPPPTSSRCETGPTSRRQGGLGGRKLAAPDSLCLRQAPFISSVVDLVVSRFPQSWSDGSIHAMGRVSTRTSSRSWKDHHGVRHQKRTHKCRGFMCHISSGL